MSVCLSFCLLHQQQQRLRGDGLYRSVATLRRNLRTDGRQLRARSMQLDGETELQNGRKYSAQTEAPVRSLRWVGIDCTVECRGWHTESTARNDYISANLIHQRRFAGRRHGGVFVKRQAIVVVQRFSNFFDHGVKDPYSPQA